MYRRAALLAVIAASLVAGARAEQADLVFDVASSELSRASVVAGQVLLELAPCKSAELRRLTQSHVGRMLSVRLDGVLVVRAWIGVPIDSGRVVFNTADEGLLRVLAARSTAPQPADGAPAHCADRPAPAP